jgi:hypothetical protein
MVGLLGNCSFTTLSGERKFLPLPMVSAEIVKVKKGLIPNNPLVATA